MSTGRATLVERQDGLVIVTLNRPEKKNALNAENWADLDRVLVEIANEPRDRALLLTGAGGNFSSGADLSGSPDGKSSLTGRDRQPTLWEMRVVGETINRLQHLPKPTIAAVDGVAIGVGLGLALACDLIVASDRARFCEIFVRRGLSLDGGTSWSLPHQIGLRRAKQLAYFGDMIDADLAAQWGLVNEVVPGDDYLPVATAWGKRLAGGPTTALSLIKRSLDASSSRTFEQSIEDEARCQQIVVGTSDIGEGIAAFLERREPRFTGI
jgi:2-(1,2-epoxy-1,2-dihydrophenyl)acetyl-CoA isomerase